ncbi:T9SS type A sorting domain-containing protein [Pontibacter sp. G13]|uniref:T9SS type A sorting domain-containing protein n=1 Tax=Pontibacter sp. G13 TaxID=3074898 RepID=UPI00288A96A3|nr:T9SS type A sorting domain-containing protein [Pontibacter sp. G13]WNJ20425.1 T9SS type A sorting domain-containing protein [Pontibacter sp. G13]
MKKRLTSPWYWFFKHLMVIGFMAVFTQAQAQIWTYSYPNNIVNANESLVKKSDIYDVKVVQGNTTQTCYVMYDRNQQTNTGNNNVKLNPDNHWTNFSKSGAVTIEITRIDGGNLNSATVYPLKKGYNATVNNNKATISIPANVDKLQIWVEINGLTDEPLFIFVDPVETDVPNINGSNVTVINTTDGINTVISKLNDNNTYAYFEPGIHKWGSQTGANYSGYQMPIKSGKRIYLPGGAYVIGSFNANSGANGWKVYGRGVISGAGLDILPTATYIPWSAVHAGSFTGARATIEGIVSMCPPHFALTVRGPVDIDNAKMISWWQSTDGTITGDNSTVDNCFFKVMDDAIKVYGNNCTHDNNTIFHQVNGAVLQFSWGGQHGDNNLVTNTYVINSVYKGLGATSNTAVINVVKHNNGETTENNTIRNVYIDNGCHRLLGMDSPTGTYRNFTIEHVELNQGSNAQPQAANSYLSGNASFSNFDIIDLQINGSPITGTNANSDQPNNGNWWFSGQSGALDISTGTSGGGGALVHLENKAHSKFLQCTDGTDGTGSGNNVRGIDNSKTGTWTQWTLVDAGGGNYRIENSEFGLWLQCTNQTDATDGQPNATNDSPTWAIRAVGTNNDGNQTKWRKVDAGNGYFRLENVQFGRWLQMTDLVDVDNTNGAGPVQVRAVPNTKTGDWTRWREVAVSARKAAPTLKVLSVYPNPTQNHLIVEGLSDMQLMEVIDLKGATVLLSEAKSKLDVSTLAPGIYLLRVEGFLPIRFTKQ